MTRLRSVAVVLAGGRSERFGRDKRVDGQALLERVVSVVAGVADATVVVLAPGDPPPTLPEDLRDVVRLAHDTVAYAGPLAGLVVGLAAIDDVDLAIVVGADMPTLQPAVLQLLLERATRADGPAAWTLEGPDPAIVGPLPLAGRVADVQRAARTLLDDGQRSLRSLVGGLEAGRVPAAEWRRFDPDGLTLRDIDRPEDLVR